MAYFTAVGLVVLHFAYSKAVAVHAIILALRPLHGLVVSVLRAFQHERHAVQFEQLRIPRAV